MRKGENGGKVGKGSGEQAYLCLFLRNVMGGIVVNVVNTANCEYDLQIICQ